MATEIRTIFCLGCARPFGIEPNDPYRCPTCGFENDANAYDRIERCAIDAVRYGWQYRQTFEVMEEDRGDTYCLPPPEQLLIWAAITVASGIIGNASWALVRNVVARLGSWATKQDGFDSTALNTLQQESRRELLLMYLSDHYHGHLPGPDHVRSAVEEEMFVHEATDLMMTKYSEEQRLPTSAEELAELFKEAFERVENPTLPTPEDFAECWKNLDLSG